LDLLEPLEQGGVAGFVFLGCGKGPFEVVEHGQQRGHDALGGVPGQFLLIAGDAFAVIFEFGDRAQILVPILVSPGRSGF
jgi:hypothetical protein